MGDRQLDLVGDDGLADVLRQERDLARGVVRDAELAHLAGVVQLVEGLGDFLGLDQSVGAVQQQDVDVVSLERAQRGVDRFDDVVMAEVETGAGRAAEDSALGLELDFGALGGRELAGLGEALLAAVVRAAIDVGMVEHSDALLARGRDQGTDRVVGHLGDAHHPRDDIRHGECGVRQSDRFHEFSLDERVDVFPV